MVIKSIIAAICVCLAVVSFNLTALPLEKDWENKGDGLITFDPLNQLEWLDLTVTDGQSFNDVFAQFGTGGAYEGWRYANGDDISGLFDTFGGDSDYYGAVWSTQNDGLTAQVIPLWFEGWNNPYASETSIIYFIWTDAIGYPIGNQIRRGTMTDYINDGPLGPELFPGTDRIEINTDYVYADWVFPSSWGHALVRDHIPVNEPSIALLLASGIGVFGVARRKVNA